MADNTTLNLGTGGDVIATDDITTLNGGVVAGVKAQRVKVGFGTDSFFRDVDATNGLPVTLTVGANSIGSVTNADVTSSGTLAAAAQTVALSVTGGMSAASAQVTGTWVGTIQFEGTVDGINWATINGVFAGTSAPGPTITANGIVRFTPAGLTSIRLNMTAFTSGSATITMRAGMGAGGTFLNQSLPIGANAIGTVTVGNASLAVTGTFWQATQPVSGTVTVGNASLAVTGAFFQATQPVSGTFFQATQPVSIAAMPTTPVTGVFFQATQPVSIAALPALTTGAAVIGAVTQSGAWNVGSITTLPALVAGAAIVGKVGIDQTTPGTTNLVSIGTSGTVAINAALPTGANTIGTVNIAAAQTVAVTQATAANLNATIVQATAANLNATVTPVTPIPLNLNSAATTNATSVKATAGTLYTLAVSNSGAAAAFLKLYNLAVAPTVGTSVPVLTIPVPLSGVVSLTLGETGHRFATGIALAITNLVADSDTTAVAAAQVKVALDYI